MQMAFYSIPARGDSGLQEDLNRFLRSHRVLTFPHMSFGAIPKVRPVRSAAHIDAHKQPPYNRTMKQSAAFIMCAR